MKAHIGPIVNKIIILPFYKHCLQFTTFYHLKNSMVGPCGSDPCHNDVNGRIMKYLNIPENSTGGLLTLLQEKKEES